MDMDCFVDEVKNGGARAIASGTSSIGTAPG